MQSEPLSDQPEHSACTERHASQWHYRYIQRRSGKRSNWHDFREGER
jgi:hypothetical protein